MLLVSKCAMAEANPTKCVKRKPFVATPLPRAQYSIEYKRVFVDLVRNQGTAEALRNCVISMMMPGQLGIVGLRT